jgi:hypothetical protein
VNIVASADMILTGESGEYVGERGLAAGDFNGDDINDLLIGAFRGNSARGKVYSFYGGKGLTGQQALSSVSDFIYTGENLNDQAGYSVSSAGDINADGIDEFLIGAPYFSSSSLQNNGKTVLLKQAQNVTPSVITSIRVLNASSQAVTQVNNRQELIIEMVANDPDATMRNIAIAQVSSDGFTRPIKVRLVETTASSGIYRGRLFLVRSRSSDKLNQLSANNGDKIHVQCNGVSLSSEPTVINAAPYITNFIPEQYGIGQTTKVRLNYILYDYDIDTCNFTVDATQVQYKKHSDSTWLNATLSGQSTLVTSFEDGKQHNADYQPLYVDMGDVDGIYDFRLKPHDGTQYATDYVTTTSFYVDNTPPAAPVLSQAQTNFAYQITVTGSAEANSAVKIYAGTVLAATATADASGYFLAYPVVISETNKAITAICYDVAGNKSPTSNTMEPTIGDVIKTVTDQDLTAVIAFPKDSLDFDFIPQLAKVATIDAQTTNGDPPTYYQYLNAFDLNFLGHDTATANSTITVTLNFTQTIRVPSLVKVYSWHNGAWSSSGITINSIATTATQTTLCFSPTYFGRFAIMDPIDPYPPVVRSVKLGSSPIVTGNYYAGNSTLNLDLYDADSGIASFSVQILSTTATAPIYSTSSRNVGTKEVQVAILPDTPLSDGTYYIQVIISDKSINSTTYTSGQFVVSDTLLQLQALQAPNPYNPDKGDLTIAYNMNQAAEVKCYILDQAGNVVFDASYALTDEDGAAGYHLLTWNGRNKFNQIVPNGLYYGYVTAKSVSDHKRAKFKIAIIR